jgi:hypothetical protein
MIKDRNILGIFFTLFLIFAVVNSVGTVSATKYKVFDKGENELIHKNSWKSYYNGKTVVSNYKMHIKYPNKKKYELYVNSKIYLTKVTKNELKITIVNYGTKYSPYNKYTDYVRTSLSAKSYYNKNYKKSFRNPGA